MFSEALLWHGWMLHADELPERLITHREAEGFSLPGADALSDFANLIDEAADSCEPAETPEPVSPFCLPGLLPDDVHGAASLSQEINFGALSGRRALLHIDQLCGRGHILLNQRVVHTFGSGDPSAEIDLTDALRLGRKQTLSLCFDDAKGAGICGAVLLRTTDGAWFEDVSLSPDHAHQTLTVSIRFHSDFPGEFAIHAALIPDASQPLPWGKSRVHLGKAGAGHLTLSFSMRAPCFQPGFPYAAPVLKLALYALRSKDDPHGILCDARTLTSGYPGKAPRAYIPLTAKECRLPPDELIGLADPMRGCALMLPAPVSSLLYRRCAQAGVALLPYTPDGHHLPQEAGSSPCAYPLHAPDPQAFAAPSPGAALWQLCGMCTASPACDSGTPDDELFLYAAGRTIDAVSPETQNMLASLRALQIRLRAEAVRQEKYTGSLCAPGEWRKQEIADALRTAFSALHLSVLPLRGAWWTQSLFSASVHVFIPEEDRHGVYCAEAELIDAQGCILTAFSRDCSVLGGAVGVMECRLPDNACMLTLRTRLKRSGAVVETQEFPVYVGMRGPLEAAF